MMRDLRVEAEKEAHPYVDHCTIQLGCFTPKAEQSYFCRKCEVRQPRTAYELHKGNQKGMLHLWCLDCRKRHPFPIADHVIRTMIRNTTKLPSSFPIPQHLIELKRKSLQLKRMCEANENH